ncbi:MAG: hypothetical protein V4819_01215 [Verrucomicrobiota bacterium]
MKPKIHFFLSAREPGNETRSGRNRSRIVTSSIAAIGLAGLTTPNAAAIDYTILPAGSPLDWNTDINWTPFAAASYPGTATGDKALVTGDFAGVAKVVDISAPIANPVTGLVLGDTNAVPVTTTVQSSNANSLPLAGTLITSTGTAGVLNTISAPITLSGNLTFGPVRDTVDPLIIITPYTNDLTISGLLTGSDSTKTITNSSGKVVTFGDIDLKTTTTALSCTIVNSNLAGDRINLPGVISNSGGAALSNLLIGGGGIFEISGINTYVGTTMVGVNAGGRTTRYYINSAQPFGPATSSTLTFGGNGNTVNILEAVSTDRTITRNGNTTINRNITFEGTLALTIDSADMRTSNSPVFTNNIITAGKVVTLGRAGGTFVLNNNATDKNANRQLLAGAGTTIILSNLLDNSGVVAPDSKNGIQMNGTGVLKLTGTSAFQGPSRITSTGTLQLGDGGITGSLVSGNGLTPVVTSNAAGILAFNRSDDHSATLAANGPLGIKQNGSGAVTLTNSQFHTGPNIVGDGIAPSKLVVNGSLVPSVAPTSVATVASVTAGNLVYRTITFSGADTTTSLNLKVGQPVYIGTPSPSAYVHSIDSPTQISVYGISLTAITAGDHTDLVFGAGSALGTAEATTTVSNNGTLSGTGSIAGNVQVTPGGHFASAIAATAGAQVPLTIGGTLTLDSGNVLDLTAAAAPADGIYILATAAGGVTYTPGTVNLTGVAGTVSVSGDSKQLLLTVGTPGPGYATWASANAGNQTANLDFDNDGVENGVEYFMGQTGSTFTPNPSINPVNNKIIWPKDAAFSGSYTVQTSPDLVTWTNVSSNLVGNTVEYTVPVGQGKIFVRLNVLPN